MNPQRLRRLLHRLVDVYSPSGKEEEILQYLRGYLKRQGMQVSIQPVDENRYNLLALPPGGDISLAFIGHLDTVIAYDLDTYDYAEKGDIIRGLGTADMKGGCAAMIETFLALHDSGCDQFPVALCLVVGEETEGDGAKQLVKEYHIPWAILGEPTDLYPCLSSYGYLEIQLSVTGRRAHASLAKETENPVEAMLRLLLNMTQYFEKERPEVVYNIRDLFSSQAGFAVPDLCQAWVDIHVPPKALVGEITTEVEEIVGRESEGYAYIETRYRNTTIDAGYELPERGPIVNALRAVYAERGLEWEPQPFRSHSDANQIWAAGGRPILLGPGGLEKAHAPDESVSFQQVCLASEIYLDLVRKLFSY